LGGISEGEGEGPGEIVTGLALIDEGYEATVPEIGRATEALENDELFEFGFLGWCGAAGGEVLGHLFVSCTHLQKATTPRIMVQQAFCLEMPGNAGHEGYLFFLGISGKWWWVLGVGGKSWEGVVDYLTRGRLAALQRFAQ
jgi:hypothetical protein